MQDVIVFVHKVLRDNLLFILREAAKKAYKWYVAGNIYKSEIYQINPNDKVHNIKNTTKIVAGCNKTITQEMKKIYGYARVSTREQHLDRQIKALRDHGIEERDIVTDHASGASLERLGYTALKGTMLRDGDTLVVKSLDRLSRNKEHIILIFVKSHILSDFIKSSEERNTHR